MYSCIYVCMLARGVCICVFVGVKTMSVLMYVCAYACVSECGGGGGYE